MEADKAAWHDRSERQCQQIIRRDLRRVKLRRGAKAKALIVAGRADEHATARADLTQTSKSSLYQTATYSEALPIRPYGDGTEAMPVALSIVDCHRREGDLANDLLVLFRH